MSRFFLNLRFVFNRGQPTLASRSVPSTRTPIGTHPFWGRVTGVSTGFSASVGAETNDYGDLFDIKEANVPEAAKVDLELAIVLQTQHGGDGPPENRSTF